MSELMQKTRKSSRKKLKGEALSALAAGHPTEIAPPLTENPSSTNLMEEIVSRENMHLALKRVMSNKGSAGCDGMGVEALPDYLRGEWLNIREKLLAGEYDPQLVRRVIIAKPDGGERKLGIPTVVDRMIQQAIQQVLTRIWEPGFSERSFGFRPGRSCHGAIELAQKQIRSGRKIVVDIDLEAFFDRVNHDRLMSRLSHRIEDERVLALIGRYLRAGILEKGLVTTPDEGTPQGGPLTPRTQWTTF